MLAAAGSVNIRCQRLWRMGAYDETVHAFRSVADAIKRSRLVDEPSPIAPSCSRRLLFCVFECQIEDAAIDQSLLWVLKSLRDSTDKLESE